MKLTQRLLDQAARAASKQKAMQDRLTEAFTNRYGITYSDVDADSILDVLDYGLGGDITLAECDAIMTEAGHPPNKGNDDDS